jgi:hypothetical protein
MSVGKKLANMERVEACDMNEHLCGHTSNISREFITPERRIRPLPGKPRRLYTSPGSILSVRFLQIPELKYASRFQVLGQRAVI